jgi:hypothetical protein
MIGAVRSADRSEADVTVVCGDRSKEERKESSLGPPEFVVAHSPSLSASIEFDGGSGLYGYAIAGVHCDIL